MGTVPCGTEMGDGVLTQIQPIDLKGVYTMSKARMAAEFCKAMALMKFPDNAPEMSKLMIDWMTFANIVDRGSHKYIPADELNGKLGLPEGAGVYGYARFEDGSYILLTCRDGIAWWDGKDTEPELIEW